MPDEHDGQAELARPTTATGSAHLATAGRRRCRRGRAPGAAHGHDRQREQPAEREPDEHVGPVDVRSLPVQPLLDGAAGEEEHLVGRHRRAEQGDGVVGVGERRLARPARGGARRRPQRVPVGSDLPHRHHEHEQAQAQQAEDALHPLERQPPDRPATPGTATTGMRKQVVDAGHQRDGDGDAGDLGGERQERDEERGERGWRAPKRGPSRSRTRSNTGRLRDRRHPAGSSRRRRRSRPRRRARPRPGSCGSGRRSRRWRRGRPCRRSRRWR